MLVRADRIWAWTIKFSKLNTKLWYQKQYRNAINKPSIFWIQILIKHLYRIVHSDSVPISLSPLITIFSTKWNLVFVISLLTPRLTFVLLALCMRWHICSCSSWYFQVISTFCEYKQPSTQTRYQTLHIIWRADWKTFANETAGCQWRIAQTVLQNWTRMIWVRLGSSAWHSEIALKLSPEIFCAEPNNNLKWEISETKGKPSSPNMYFNAA